jgi:UPF0755 protein
MSVLRLIAVAVTLVIAAIVSVLAWANWPIHLHHGVIEVTIPPKTSMQGIARMVSDSGAPIPALLFDVLARADGRATHIQAGTYAIEEGMTPLSVLARMERGEVVQIELVIPEGWTFHQMRAAVASDTDLQQTVATLDDATLMHRLGATESSPEGLFFPDTYRFARGTPDIEIYRRAYLAMAKHLRDGWAQRAPDLPLDSPYQALILASIIEKETGRAEDRALISAVFNNRLRKHMLLQTDPSVIYGAVRWQLAQSRPDKRYALQHLRARGTAADANRLAGPGGAYRSTQPGCVRSALFCVPRRWHQPVLGQS